MVDPQDEYRHAEPEGLTEGLWGDTLWVSVVDPKANVFGINHFHLTTAGYARFEALYLIEFEIRGGPKKGDRRRIDGFSHRDHSWSTRFGDEPRWEWIERHIPGHFWPSIQLPDKHINAFGVLSDRYKDAQGKPPVGGFLSDASGTRALLDASAEVLFEDDRRSAMAFRYRLTLPDEQVIHVRTGRKYGMVKLWDRAENDLENRLDCYEPFFDFEVEENGERGCGVAEYSVAPPWPRWLV